MSNWERGEGEIPRAVFKVYDHPISPIIHASLGDDERRLGLKFITTRDELFMAMQKIGLGCYDPLNVWGRLLMRYEKVAGDLQRGSRFLKKLAREDMTNQDEYWGSRLFSAPYAASMRTVQ